MWVLILKVGLCVEGWCIAETLGEYQSETQCTAALQKQMKRIEPGNSLVFFHCKPPSGQKG